MDSTPKKFKTEFERLQYAQELAKQKVSGLSQDVHVKWGKAHLLSILERDILKTLPPSDEHTKKPRKKK